MKVLQVITSLQIGGAEKLVAEMVPLMCEQGVQVDVLTFNGKPSPLKSQLMARGINVISLSTEECSVYHPKFVYKLSKHLPQYDIVHTHNTACQWYAVLASLLNPAYQRPKIITTEHSTTNNHRKIPLLNLFDRWIYSKYDKVVAISEKARANLANYTNLPVDLIKVINNGVNLSAFDKSYDLNLKEDACQAVVTMVAAFRQEKDHKTLIRAIALLPKQYVLFLVGDGPCRKTCEELADELGIDGRVHFMGWRTDVPAILQASDIVVLSSTYEGLSLSSVEGMASGKPFIASDVDGLHEIVEGAGILFQQGNAEELATRILELKDKNDYIAVAEKCKLKAAKYDIKNTVNEYLEIYREIL